MKPEQTKDKLTIFIKIVPIKMKESDKTKTIVGRVMNEPTMHFFIIAVVIFMVYEISNLGSKDIVEIDQREIDARILMQEMASGQPLTPDQ